MTQFGIEAPPNAEEYFRELRENQAESFFSFVLTVTTKKRGSGWIIKAEPNFPPVYWGGLYVAALSIIGWGFFGATIGVIFLLVAAFIGSIGLFWTPIPYYLAARTALKRRGIVAHYVGRRELFRRGWL